MARTKFASPTLAVEIAPKDWEKAKQSASGGCLIADAIKRQYPQYTNVSVDVATIRLSDREAGERYTYLTPPSAKDLLLYFDQGWTQPMNADEGVQKIRLRRAVVITPMSQTAERQRRTAERLAQLEAKDQAGEELTSSEKATLTRLRKSATRIRPTTYGPTEAKDDGHGVSIRRGREKGVRKQQANPNLLGGRDRHWGAKQAQPGEVFAKALAAETAAMAIENEELRRQLAEAQAKG